MFQNSYQNGTYFDLFDPKLPADKLKPLYRTVNVQGNNKVFDKELKTFVLEFLSPNARMCLPREQKKDLYLIQQYLVFQIYIFPGMPWSIELVLSDLTKTKRRVILSPSAGKTQIKPFFVKTPCLGYKENAWNNLTVDLYSYMTAFKGQTYRSLDGVSITGHFRLRRIYTAAGEPLEGEGENQSQEIKQINFLPKNFYFPAGVPYASKMNRYDPEPVIEAYEPTEPSTKNSSFLKSSKAKTTQKPSIGKGEAVKTQKLIKDKQKVEEQDGGKRIKDFLSNTNGELISRKKKEQEKSESEQSQVIIEGVPRTAKSTEKYSKKKNLIKTQQMPPKARSSLDKNPRPALKIQDKSRTKAKLNPWRTTSKQVAGSTDNSQIQTSKNCDERSSVNTPQTLSAFQQAPRPIPPNPLTNNPKFSQTKNQRFDGRSDNYSDSEYVELSQKFSTLTDGKFFRNETALRRVQPEAKQVESCEGEDEIQENIEMESNSVYSSAKRQEQPPQKHPQNPQFIQQSICDSLERFEEPQRKQDLGRSSLYGFGERLMKRFMHEVQRPYSPPIGQREVTEEEVSEHYRHEEKDQVELVYDPVLNCYYDHKTHTYYELKN